MMKTRRFEITSFLLHVIAMGLMLCDHMWATIFPNDDWLTCIGRLAFPIFAFMIAEGFRKTHDRRKYVLRVFIFALIAEVPFDLMYGSTPFYPYHQNVLWTFLVALICMSGIEAVKKKENIVLTVFVAAVITLCGFVIGSITMVDYYGAGVLAVLLFYFTNRRKATDYIIQLIGMYILNVKMLGGYYFTITVLGHEFEIVQQGLALFALIPIWLYHEKQGYHSKWFQYVCYLFYPVHMLVIYVVWQLIG